MKVTHQLQMEQEGPKSEDPLDIAYTAIMRVADTASQLGAKHKSPMCGRLGAQLLLVADCLNTDNPDQEERLRVRISKLMKEVENICKWRVKPTLNKANDSLLNTVAKSEPRSAQYTKAQEYIQQGIMNFAASSDKEVEKFIAHLQKFTMRHGNAKRDDIGEEIPKDLPAEYQKENKILVNLLQDEMSCTCDMKMAEQVYNTHLAQILLQPPSQSMTEQGHLQYNMLFSSAPVSNGGQFGQWRDVQLVISRIKRRSNRNVKFLNCNTSSSLSASPTQLPKVETQADQELFCALISRVAYSRLCLTVQDEKLTKSEFKIIERIVEHIPGISLTDTFKQYHFTLKTKLILAYILVYAAWQYYDLDWMKTGWTSDLIQFMKERRVVDEKGENSILFAWKPYLPVRGGKADTLSCESSDLKGKIHPFPRIQALGIMLVEIGIGSPLYKDNEVRSELSPIAKANKDLLMAVEYLGDKTLWKDLKSPQYQSYRIAVENCLDPKTFDGYSDKADGLKQFRDVLYHKVVFHLEVLLQEAKWMDNLTEIGPLMPLPGKFVDPAPQHPLTELATAEGASVRRTAKNTLSQSQKDAQGWLSRIQRLNDEFSDLSTGSANSPSPIRIAVLDTGCDDGSLFFYQSDNASRLREWKDWTGKSDVYQDCHGHGTYLTSLVMKLCPGAHIYVARVAKDPDDLLNSSENVAKAISWASKEWKADIILMSFGFKEEQLCISRAIRGAMHERDDSILLFAAASNYGANEQEMFPARYESVISIRGTNANGDFEDFNPPRSQNEEIVFGTLGLDVPSAGLSDYSQEVYKSGTSVAAAVAAGIAGLLLGYVSKKSETATFPDLDRKLRTRQGMRAVFMKIASQTQKEHCSYLTPWKLMGKSEEARWAIILAAVDDIL